MRSFLFIPLIFCCVMTACKKDTQNATVVIDCTGTYLRVDNKDYQVCNDDKLAGFENGTAVEAGFEKISECTALKDRVVCFMLHANEGFITVNRIKRK